MRLHRKQRARDKKKSANKYAAAPGKVVPVETNPGASVGAEGAIAKEFDSPEVVTTAAGDAGEGARLEEGGIAAAAAGGVPGAAPAVEAKLAVEERHR